MPQAVNTSVENSFVEGLKTEFTGLNFPENACTAADNCVFTLIGEVFRRQGIDYESNYTSSNINRSGLAISSYIWTNVGGDGQTKVYVLQVGGTLYFYQLTNSTAASPLSTTKLSSTVTLTPFLATGSTANPNITECQYTDGNGYLFVFHPNCDPFYCTFTAGVIASNSITVQIRDMFGIVETGVLDTSRPSTLTADHNYNINNQGWSTGSNWATSSNTVIGLPIQSSLPRTITFTVPAGLSPAPTGGDTFSAVSSYVTGYYYPVSLTGTVTSYSGSSLTVSATVVWYGGPQPVGSDLYTNAGPWSLSATNTGYLKTWNTALGNYPSNSDVWWQFKDSSGAFSPGTTINKVTLNAGPAPKGYYILNAFNQARNGVSGLNIPTLSTLVRPRTGCWFQGRVFYAGVDSATSASPEFPFYSWTETIYFSQIVQGNNTSTFGKCYETNDPTSETLFDLLPSDGGTIAIQGCGSIYKLFPVQNGLLVFAANGIWFITGSQGIGFSATDYTITKLSGIQSISSTSYINVMGYPIFWNEEGIYGVAPSQSGALTVNNLCLGTILSFYLSIPLQSKRFVRGDYDPLTFQIKWVYRSTNESSVTDRYQFDKILNFNVIHKSFFYHTLPNGTSPNIHDVKYVASPGGTGSPAPVMKFLTSSGSGVSYNFTFSEEIDPTFVDWKSSNGVGTPFTSTFTTGYKVHGQALRKFQPMYVYVYSRNDVQTAYTLNAIWDFATSGNSGRYSVRQQTTNYTNRNQGMVYRRHRLRGHGMSLQLQFTSIPNQPFEIMGWAIYEQITMSP